MEKLSQHFQQGRDSNKMKSDVRGSLVNEFNLNFKLNVRLIARTASAD